MLDAPACRKIKQTKRNIKRRNVPVDRREEVKLINKTKLSFGIIPYNSL